MIGQKQIDEYNILIARFMGARDSGETRLIDDIKHPLIVYYGNSGAMSCYVEIPGLIHKVYDVSSLQFNLFWDDWLIEVVERIESLTSNSGGHWGVHINSNSCAIQDTKFRFGLLIQFLYLYYPKQIHDNRNRKSPIRLV